MIAFICALVCLVKGWDCGGGRSFIKNSVQFYSRSLTRSTTQSPIRIHYEFIDFDLGSELENTYFKDQLLSAANNFFTKSIRINNVIGNLTVTELECDPVKVPASHLKQGISNADMVIYITSVYNTEEGFLAYAGPCELDSDFKDVPIMGVVVVNQAYYSSSDLESRYSTIVHEIFHIFGFNSYLFDYWKRPDGSSYAPNEIYEDIEIRGTVKTVIKTPNVMEKAVEAFGCSTIRGIELEEYGGEGTAGSHWDMRIMFNDFMMGKDIYDPIYSDISLALLKDTGWYDIDYTYATQPNFGYKAGCDFFEKPCLTNEKSNFPDMFCDNFQSTGTCDSFHLRKSYCDMAVFDSIPEEFNYYFPRLIGGDPYADFCPVFRGFPDGNCRSENQTLTKTLASTDEVIGPHSKCFVSTLSRGNPLKDYSACYEVIKCTANSATVQIGQSTIECPFNGGEKSVKGYSGLIKCPRSSILCENFPCLNGCSGQGICVNGVCKCDKGYYGDNCFLKRNS